jgi:hypothetical protein
VLEVFATQIEVHQSSTAEIRADEVTPGDHGLRVNVTGQG